MAMVLTNISRKLNHLETFLVTCCRQFSSNPDQKETEKPQLKNEKEIEESRGFLRSFASRENQFMELHRMNPMTITRQRFREWTEKTNKNAELFQQQYIPERHQILGADLATAHFLVFRGGKVKFSETGAWIEKLEGKDTHPELPDKFVRNMFLHSVDASNIALRYEALENFRDLTRLKWMSFRNNKQVDSWFLDRIAAEFSKTLEYLDIQNCEGVTEDALSCIYKLSKLKTLRVTNCAGSRNFQYMCLLLEDYMPNLTIEGAIY